MYIFLFVSKSHICRYIFLQTHSQICTLNSVANLIHFSSSSKGIKFKSSNFKEEEEKKRTKQHHHKHYGKKKKTLNKLFKKLINTLKPISKANLEFMKIFYLLHEFYFYYYYTTIGVTLHLQKWTMNLFSYNVLAFCTFILTNIQWTF